MAPYLVIRTRTLLFEEAVMRACGVQRIPTFDSPSGRDPETSGQTLGHACGGAKIQKCQAWLQERAPKRLTDGKELPMVVDTEKLATVLCRVCKG